MLGIGFEELAVVLVAVVVLVRPRDLPALFRKAGRLWGELRSLGDKARASARDAARDLRIDEEEEEGK